MEKEAFYKIAMILNQMLKNSSMEEYPYYPFNNSLDEIANEFYKMGLALDGMTIWNYVHEKMESVSGKDFYTVLETTGDFYLLNNGIWLRSMRDGRYVEDYSGDWYVKHQDFFIKL